MEKEYVIEGLSKEQVIEVNQVRDGIKEVVTIHEKNIEQFKDVLEKLEVQRWFLAHSTKRFNLKEQQVKYNNFKNKQTEVTEREILNYKGLLEKEEVFYSTSNNFLELFDSQVEIKETETEFIFTYKTGFYQLILQFAKTLGFKDLS